MIIQVPKSGLWFLFFASYLSITGSTPPKKDIQSAILQNQKVKAIFKIDNDQTCRQEFFARGSNGEWKLVLSRFTPVYKGDSSEVQLWNTSINPYRHLAGSMTVSGLTEETHGGQNTVTIIHHEKNIEVSEKFSLSENDSFVHVEVKAKLTGELPKLDYLLSTFAFHETGSPDFVHSPAVKFDDPRSGPGKNQVFGDRSFHSPAIIIQHKSFFGALVPDLEMINQFKVLSPNARRSNFYTHKSPFGIDVPEDRITMPSALDLNLHSGLTDMPLISYGLMDTKIGFHTRFIRGEKDSEMVRTLESRKIAYGFDLFVHANAADADYSAIVKHLWKRYGAAEILRKPQLAMPYQAYVKLVQNAIFHPIVNKDGSFVNTPAGIMDTPVAGFKNRGSWLEWKDGGTMVGGFRCAAPFWYDVINNSDFWNQARDATGMYYWGKLMKDTFLVHKARLMINFCLTAPRNKDGLFSTVYDASKKKWGIGWTDPPNGKNVFFLKDSKSYEIPLLCKTGAHLLDYYQRAEKDDRIISYLQPFANWLLAVIDKEGCVASFVTIDMQSSPILYTSAQPAAALWFLAEMYNTTRDRKYLEGAEKIALYMEKEIIPGGKWIDMEQYISCGAKPFSMEKDYWQDEWFRGTLCLIWACEGFASLHRATADPRWLHDGEKSIDYLSFSQCCWRPHFIYSADPFGGFNTDNADIAVMMDQRQAETVRSYIYFGENLSRQDLVERGIAAGQSGCVLIRDERHISNGITPSPLFYPEGLAPENIDHEGICQWPMRTHPLWGEASAVFTGLKEINAALGGLYINPGKNVIVSANGIRIDNISHRDDNFKIKTEGFLSSKYLKQPWEESYTDKINVVDSGRLNIVINGSEIKSKQAATHQVLVSAGGSVSINNK